MKIKSLFMPALLAGVLLLDACNDHVINEDNAEQASEATLSVEGGTANLLTGNDAGLPLSKFPQVKLMSLNSAKNMKTPPETGVYLVGSAHVPYAFQNFLKNEGLTLHDNGLLLDKEGNKVTLFVHSETFEIVPDAPKNGRTKLAPFRATMDGYTKLTQSWSCRYFHSYAEALAWKPEKVNGEWVPLNIDQIKCQTTIGLTDNTPDDTGTCTNCSKAGAHEEWKVGCGWPAVPIVHGKDYGYFKEGAVVVEKNVTW
jgi:hypothetical protein